MSWILIQDLDVRSADAAAGSDAAGHCRGLVVGHGSVAWVSSSAPRGCGGGMTSMECGLGGGGAGSVCRHRCFTDRFV